MSISIAIMIVISFLWFVLAAGSQGFFGVHAKRSLIFKSFDHDNSKRLLRVLERYKNGEYTVQFSKYNDNLLFTKVLTNNAHVEYDAQKIYVNIGDENSHCFGWMTDEPLHHKMLANTTRCAYNNEAYDELQKIIKILREKDDAPKGRWFRKHKNEEVRLS